MAEIRRQRVVVESPMRGADYADLVRNLRYAAWACRAEIERGNDPLASHLFLPLFLDDRVPAERDLGRFNAHFWEEDVLHAFYADLCVMNSDGTLGASKLCASKGIPWETRKLPPEMLQRFERGEWPPHTEGFMTALAMSAPVVLGEHKEGAVLPLRVEPWDKSLPVPQGYRGQFQGKTRP